MRKIRVKLRELPFGTHITICHADGTEENAVVFGRRLGFENGKVLDFGEVENNCKVFLGWNTEEDII